MLHLEVFQRKKTNRKIICISTGAPAVVAIFTEKRLSNKNLSDTDTKNHPENEIALVDYAN